jgi:aspartyl-tRNA(Asn)/glutamyl-tRNA(Gln) amidotransferase subunit A
MEGGSMSDELTWLDAWELRDLVARGEVSAVEVVDHFLARIEELDPKLNAFAHLDPAGAREQAAGLDEARRRGDALGALHGLPMAVKENLRVAGLPYSFPRLGETDIAKYDAIAVERLRAAGAVIVGTNTMMGTAGPKKVDAQAEAPTIGAFNWDAEARNPWDPSRVPGWSSAGGAATVAAALLPVAIGSDGGGSTRIPGAFSGLVAVHPTQGLIPHVDYQRPKLRFSATFGPLARSVRDAALVTQALAGPDGRDYICIQESPRNYLEVLDAGVDGMRVAWTDDYGFTGQYATEESSRVIAQVRQRAFQLREQGAVVEETSVVWEPARRGGGPGPGEPAVYEIEVSANTHPLPPTDPELYREALAWRTRNWERFRTLFQSFDLLLSVTSQHIAPTMDAWRENWTTPKYSSVEGGYAAVYTAHTVLFNLLGLPAVSVPCGFVDGMPVALQIVGPPSSEDRIFRLASAFQQAFPLEGRPPLS